MPSSALAHLPSHSFIVIDANIFIYGLSGQSTQCAQFLDRCLHEEVTGITLFETVNEVTHRFMLAEALAKGLITRGTVKRLREQVTVIPKLTDYWVNIERLLALNLLFVPVNEEILRAAQSARRDFGLLTNDSMIISCMREYGVSFLATNDADFERVAGITVFQAGHKLLLFEMPVYPRWIRTGKWTCGRLLPANWSPPGSNCSALSWSILSVEGLQVRRMTQAPERASGRRLVMSSKRTSGEFAGEKGFRVQFLFLRPMLEA